MKRAALFVVFLLVKTALVYAEPLSIDHFTIKENPFAKDEIAIVATDTGTVINETISGLFSFSINGFSQELRFDKGTAFYRHKIDKSTFVYIKHVNDTGTHSNLYYLYRHDGVITPVHIQWTYLVLIPVVILLLAYLFRKLLVLAVILIVGFFVFNHMNGLEVGTFFETIVDGLRGLF
ncbi:MAG: hypothetical protein INR69_11615 [Mucilaginibacter polytrichastri]|nr:hypothetical protein [Mucilaginibacter polytrichastri]